MLINSLPKDQIDLIAKPFREEVGPDFLDCWGDMELNILFKIVEEGGFGRNPKTKEAILKVAKLYGKEV